MCRGQARIVLQAANTHSAFSAVVDAHILSALAVESALAGVAVASEFEFAVAGASAFLAERPLKPGWSVILAESCESALSAFVLPELLRLSRLYWDSDV